MENFTFSEQERVCTFLFADLGNSFHLCTPEDHPLIFRNESDYKTGMSILGLCALFFPKVRILTFELMSNHLHIVAAGTVEDILAMFALFKSLLARYFESKGEPSVLRNFDAKLIRIDSLDNLRNAITYVNRNGYVVQSQHIPFSYMWGANRYYFNPEAKLRYEECGRKSNLRFRQGVTRSRKFDFVENAVLTDGYVSPMCFCDIKTGEALFRNAHNYFYKLTRNQENCKFIADSIGEKIYYTDDDMFTVVSDIALKKWSCKSPGLLPAAAKLELAKEMHFNYNASDKQIVRMLKMDPALVRELFPKPQ